MDWLVIEGIAPWDGRYEFEIVENEFSIDEWGWVKRLAGYLPGTFLDGWEGADPELFGTFAVIALHRAGRVAFDDVPDTYRRLAAHPPSRIRLELGDTTEADDAGPPAVKPSLNGTTSGTGSRTSSESSDAPTPPAIGTPGSAISESALTTSVT